MLTLFPDEKIVVKSNKGIITLTTHRICKEVKGIGRSYNQSIMLEHITSCENSYRSQLWLLIIGIVLLIAGTGLALSRNGRNSPYPLFLLGGIVLAILYWLTRKNFIRIASPSTNMFINVKSMRKENVLDFINKVEHTKHQRIVSLNNKPNIIV